MSESGRAQGKRGVLVSKRDDLAAMLGALVRLKRQENDLSMHDLEKLLPDVSVSTISRVESGRLPDLDTFLQLVDWLDVSECSLLFPDERQPISALQRVALLLEYELGVDHDFVAALVTVIRLIQLRKEASHEQAVCDYD